MSTTKKSNAEILKRHKCTTSTSNKCTTSTTEHCPKCRKSPNCYSSDSPCSTDKFNCGCNNSSNFPFGIIIIPGSGKLTECPSSFNSLNEQDNVCNILDCIADTSICPRINTGCSICIKNCSEFAALACVNFINADIVITSEYHHHEHHEHYEPYERHDRHHCSSFPCCSDDALDIFPNLLGINGSLYIINTNYTKISGFEKLRFITGSIVIVNNPTLVCIPSFPSLLNVGGEVLCKGIFDHGSSGELPPVTVPAPALPLPPNPTHDDSHKHTTEVCPSSYILIANNLSLRKIIGFEALRQVSDGIFIAANHCLTQICGFTHLYNVKRLVIFANPSLCKIVGFCYLDSLSNGLYIVQNGSNSVGDLGLDAFLALENAGAVVFIQNSTLQSIKLDALNAVGILLVSSNDCLELISVGANIIGILSIIHNKNLKSIDFPNLTTVGGNLTISANCSLPVLCDFNKLQRVTGGIIISENSQLSEINAFNTIKYIGSNCSVQFKFGALEHHSDQNLGQYYSQPQCPLPFCFIGEPFNWEHINVSRDCEIKNHFNVNVFDFLALECGYALPPEFYSSICNKHQCCSFSNPSCGPLAVNYSIIIYKNQRLKEINAFNCLKEVNSSIYIIDNANLCSIIAFKILAFALDIWIRNNSCLKTIKGLNKLLFIRDLVVYETSGLSDFNGIKSLEFAQTIRTEAKTANSIVYAKYPIPSILGYILYYCYVPNNRLTSDTSDKDSDKEKDKGKDKEKDKKKR